MWGCIIFSISLTGIFLRIYSASLLTAAPGSVNGTTQADRVINRVGLGTGVFALGAPRSIEFGTRIAF